MSIASQDDTILIINRDTIKCDVAITLLVTIVAVHVLKPAYDFYHELPDSRHRMLFIDEKGQTSVISDLSLCLLSIVLSAVLI